MARLEDIYTYDTYDDDDGGYYLQNDYCYTVLLMLLLVLISQFEISFQLFFLALPKVPSSTNESVTSFLLKCFAISESVFHMFSSLKGEWEYKECLVIHSQRLFYRTQVTNCSDCTHWMERKRQRMRFAERVKQNNANDWSNPKKHKWDDTNTKSKEKERVHKMGGVS